MEDQTHHGLHEQLEAIQIQAGEHTLQSNEHGEIEIATEHDPVSQQQIAKHKAHNRPRIFAALKCSKCNKRFRNPSLLQHHVKLHRGSTIYRCGHCQDSFRELNKFLEHRVIHPPLRKRRKALDGNAFQLVHKANENHPGVADPVAAEAAQNMGLPSTSSIMNALCSALSSQADGQNQPTSTVSAKPGGSEGIQIELPTQVKAIYFNHQSPNFSELMSFMMMVNNKMDSIIKHFNVPTNVQSAGIEMQNLKPQPEEQQPQQQQPETTTTPTPTSNTPTPPVVHTPTSKEQQQQEYYASTLISSTPSKPWLNVLSTPFTLNLPHIAEQAVLQPAGVLQNHLAAAAAVSYVISDSIIEKVFLESRSRGNFAKNLTFQVFSSEERRGRNCTGRVFGRALPKGPLDSGKLNAVKDATFRKYPCHPSLVDITWKKECITAIDSGLRNETRTRVKSLENQVGMQYEPEHKVEVAH